MRHVEAKQNKKLNFWKKKDFEKQRVSKNK
jgi:hypothetical protein